MIGGLLDFARNPAGLGLLSGVAQYAAGAGRGGPINSIGRGLLGGLAGYAQAQDRETELAQLGKRNELFELQLAQHRQEAVDTAAIRAAAQRNQTPSVPGMGGLNDSLPPELRTPVMPGRPARFNTQGFISDVLAINPIKGMEWQTKLAKEQPKVKSTEVGRDPRTGQLVNFVLYEDGRTETLPFGVKPHITMQSLGNRVVAIDQNAVSNGQAFDIGQSPDNAASVGATIRGQNLTNALGWANNAVSRAQLEQGKTELVNDAHQGPILVNKTTGLSAPVKDQAGAPLQSSNAAKQVAGSKKALEIINEAETLIGKATGSWLGAGYDLGAAAFGSSTEGARNVAKLKALEGSLMMAQPRMEGPQSNTDVMLYRQMAGQIGDPTVPTGTKQAALDTIRSLHERYAGIEPSQSRPAPAAAAAAPTASMRWNPQTRKLEQVR